MRVLARMWALVLGPEYTHDWLHCTVTWGFAHSFCDPLQIVLSSLTLTEDKMIRDGIGEKEWESTRMRVSQATLGRIQWDENSSGSLNFLLKKKNSLKSRVLPTWAAVLQLLSLLSPQLLRATTVGGKSHISLHSKWINISIDENGSVKIRLHRGENRDTHRHINEERHYKRSVFRVTKQTCTIRTETGGLTEKLNVQKDDTQIKTSEPPGDCANGGFLRWWDECGCGPNGLTTGVSSARLWYKLRKSRSKQRRR